MPKTAVPNALPSVRKKVTPEVAVPNCAYGTVFCTTIVSTCIARPIPRPRISMYSDSSQTLVLRPIVDIKNSPIAITPVPAIGNQR